MSNNELTKIYQNILNEASSNEGTSSQKKYDVCKIIFIIIITGILLFIVFKKSFVSKSTTSKQIKNAKIRRQMMKEMTCRDEEQKDNESEISEIEQEDEIIDDPYFQPLLSD